MFEYIPFANEDGFDRTNHFHPAVHWDQSGNAVLPTERGAENGYIGASQFGIDLNRPGWHTFAIEWNRNCQVFSIDGQRFWTNTERVSPAESHALMLTLEAADGDEDGFNTWGRPVGDIFPNVRNENSYFDVDSVRVQKKETIDASLCSGN